MFDDLTGSLRSPAGDWTPKGKALFDQLPADYQEFLLATNGGYVEEGRYSFEISDPRLPADARTFEDDVLELRGIYGKTPAPFKSRNAALDLVRSFESKVDAHVLPSRVLGIAYTDNANLVCLSLRESDFGTIHYWVHDDNLCHSEGGEWELPTREEFELRVPNAAMDFDAAKSILTGPDHPRREEAEDTLKSANLIRLAPSFREWAEGCFDDRA
jgi:hypothetical protein